MGFATGAKSLQDIFEDIVIALINSGVWYNVDTTWSSSSRLIDNNCRRVLAYGGIAGSPGEGNTIISSPVATGTNTLSVTDISNFSIGDKLVLGSGNTAEVRVVSLIASGIVPAGTITVDSNFNTNHLVGEIVKGLNFEIYLAMEVINQTSGAQFYYGNAYWYYGKGIRFVFSASWDATAHTYPTSNQSTFVTFENCYNCGVSTNLATTMITYWLWLEDNGNGFVIMGKPEPTSSSHQQSFIIVVERNTAKEYTDGYTNFYIYKSTNINPEYYDGNWPASIWRDRALLRPFAYQWPDYGSGNWGTWSPNGNGISFIPTPTYYAYKSNGDGKVYFVRPLLHNSAGQTIPIFQSSLFFMWSEGVGLIDGDIIAIEGQTTKYLCKGLDSPDSTNRITYAMKYVA